MCRDAGAVVVNRLGWLSKAARQELDQLGPKHVSAYLPFASHTVSAHGWLDGSIRIWVGSRTEGLSRRAVRARDAWWVRMVVVIVHDRAVCEPCLSLPAKQQGQQGRNGLRHAG